MSDVGTGILGFVGMSALAGVLVTAAVTPALAVTGMAANNGISMFENLPGYLDIGELSEKTDIYATQPDGSSGAPRVLLRREPRGGRLGGDQPVRQGCSSGR